MKKTVVSLALIMLSFCVFAGSINAVAAGADNTDLQYRVSETDFNLKRSLKKVPVNQWSHKRVYSDVKTQQVIRENQDGLYSSAVVDVSEGATITVPQYPYYSTIEVIDMQNYAIATVYPGQSVHITKDDLSYGNYVYLNARTRPTDDAKNLDGAYKQQDALTIEAPSSKPYTTPDVVLSDEELLRIRTKLIKEVKDGKVKSYLDMMGKKDFVDRQDHLYATAYGWGGLPAQDAVYMPLRINVKGTECSSVTIDAPPVNYDKSGFWSITTYNKEGWLAFDRAAIFNKDVVANEDGTVTVRFNCDGQANNLQAVDGFSAVLRMYMPISMEKIRSYIDHAIKNYVITSVKNREVATEIIVPTVPSDVPGFVDGAPLSPQYVETIGSMAYIWAWPLINMNSRHTMFSMAPEPVHYGGVLPIAPIGQLSMLADYIQPQQRFVTCPNQDVVYGAGFFSLDEQPVIIQVPDFKDRFWVYQIVDQRTDSFAEVGIQYKTEPGFYLLVGPDWNGKKPDGVKNVFRSNTNISAIFPRIFMDDTKEDRNAIQPLINKVVAYPLSEYDGKMKTKVWKNVPILENKNAGGSTETQWVNPEKFADELQMVLKQVKPLPGEEALYGMIQSVVNAANNDPALKQALINAAQKTEKEVIADMFEFRNNGVEAGNGWRTQKNAAQFGVGYFQRTATAKGNMFSNRGIETMYFGTDFDSNGDRINANKKYTVKFAKGEVPPVNGFWSLTLYNEKHFFAPNTLSRFSLGTKNKGLVSNKDGSLTIYVQSASPGKDKESNWLPAPQNGNYSLYIRAYWPQQAIFKGDWIPPEIKAVQ